MTGRDALEFKAAVDARVAAIEALATAGFAPPWPGCVDPGRSAYGEDFAIVALRVSEEFWDDEDGEALVAAHEEFESEKWGVILALDTRWGERVRVEMEPYAELDAEGAAMPPFFAALCELGYFDDLAVWRVGDRRLAVGAGQMDAEEPVVLFAAVTSSDEGFPGRGH
ncbi:hypothetical protein [Streptomyces sp. SYSU K217416]